MARSQIATFSPPWDDPNLTQVRAMLLDGQAVLTNPDGETVSLPPSVYAALLLAVELMTSGNSIAIVSQPQYLTSQQAAQLLGCSRPHLYTLLDRGELPFTQVGRHRRLLLPDVMAYRLSKTKERQQALSLLAQLSQKI
jgi:excisionase family DNA binding protein